LRSRNIKPGFFKNEALWDLPPLTRILFSGLWCLADREGRLEDRPKRIKVEVLPADDYDADAGLQALHGCGLIERYEADGVHYIQILKFLKHQTPHVKEAPSTIPAPCKNQTGIVQAHDEHQKNTSVAPPDSLIPDSGFSDCGGCGGTRVPAREDNDHDDGGNDHDSNDPVRENGRIVHKNSDIVHNIGVFGNDGDAKVYRENMVTIEDKAKGMGMAWALSDVQKANALMADYTPAWLLEAMDRAAGGQASCRSWRYIEAILRAWRQNSGIDSDKQPKARASPSALKLAPEADGDPYNGYERLE